MTGKEFMEVLLASYGAEGEEERPEIANDVQELESLAKRICNIYVNMGERMNTLLSDRENYYKGAVGEKDELIKNLEEKIKELEKTGKDWKEKAGRIEKEKDNIEKGNSK